MFRKWPLLFLLLLVSFVECKLPHLNPSDVKTKLNEILKAHVSCKMVTPEIMKKVLQNFLEELDPMKTYFLDAEIASWTQPTDELLQQTAVDFKHSDYSLFQKIHAVLLQAIHRRNDLETQLLEQSLPPDVRPEEFKNLEWAKNEEDLKTRLLRMKALQTEAAKKLGEESRDRFVQCLKKRRLNRESELTGQGQPTCEVILTYILKATTAALDAHTNYFTPSEANQFMIQVQQRLFGIGAQLRDDLDGLTVMRILENSPASQSKKIKLNDKIIAVDQEPVLGMDLSEAVELIRGEKGTTVHLTILREGEENGVRKSEKLEVEMIRSEVVLEEFRLETQSEPFGDGQIVLLRLFSFYQDSNFSSAQDMRKALELIKKDHKLKGVVVDLRDNAGGLLTQAVEVTGLFIKNGIVVSVKDNTGALQHLREVEGNPVWDGPLIVLVNRASASAAEIVAQTLQDYGRALVVGDAHTFGKGSFQTFTLDPIHHPKINPQGEYKVTRGKYYTVSGKSPQLNGVLSDIVIPGILSQIDIGERFAKFPLENDCIEPHFDDDLSDISAFHRLQLGASYRNNLQAQLTLYAPYLERLKKNSQFRIDSNKSYKNFLSEIEKKNFDSPQVDFFHQSDLQLHETLNVMKDLIYLMREDTMLVDSYPQ